MTETAWTALQQRLLLRYDDLKRQLARYLGSADLADDALQDTWLRLERGGEISTVRSPDSYLFRTALNFARGQLRAESRRLTTSEVEVLLNIADEAPDAARTVEARADLDALKAVMAELPARQRAILVAARLEETPRPDIARQSGIDYNEPSSAYHGQYSHGYQAINTLFPAAYGYTANALTGGTNGANGTVDTGDLDMRGSTIQTQQGGNISLLGPGGRILVGSTSGDPVVNPPNGAKLSPASEDILTLESGNIDIFADRDVLVAQSRVMTEQGGNIVMWSSNGDLDAGKGSKTSVSAPPPLYACDVDWVCKVDLKGLVSGAGIATLQTLPDTPTGDANLIAPRGTVNAGAAGIRVSGDLNVAALYVANVFNIDVKGITTGVPEAAVPNIGALTTASNATGAADAAAASRNSRQTGPRQTDLPSIITIEVIGYGGGDGTQEPQDKRQEDDRRRKRQNNSLDDQGYDPNRALKLVGNGRLTEEQTRNLTEEERNKLNSLISP